MAPESSKSPPDAATDPAQLRAGNHRVTNDEDTIEFRWYLRALQRGWKAAIAGALIGGAIALWFASGQPLRYEASTTVLVVPPAQPNAAFNPATFRTMVTNGSLVSQVIAELKLGEGEHALTPQEFLAESLRVEEVRGTNLVRITVTLRDSKASAEASRRLAMKAIALTEQMRLQDGDSVQGQLQHDLDEAQRKLANAEKELLVFKQNADAQLKERGALLRLVVEIEAEKARLAAALTEIKRQQPLLSDARLPGAEDALRRVDADAQNARDKAGEANSRHLDLTNPYVNPVYQTLEYQIATSRTRIAALERERDELVTVKKLGGSELALLKELYRRQSEQARLQANFDLAVRIQSDVVMRQTQSRSQAPANTMAQLQIVDEALPPQQPLTRRRMQFAAYGAAAGLVAGTMAMLLWENRRRF
jgi:uncharacterized protein involved in exopolysaccharide biosynthesis